MAATSTSSGCIHSSLQSRPVRRGVQSVLCTSRHTSRSLAACSGTTRPNINKFLQGWHGQSFCRCCFAKLALAVAVKSQHYALRGRSIWFADMQLLVISALAGQALVSSSSTQAQSRTRSSILVRAGLGDRASRVAKGYAFFYTDSAGQPLCGSQALLS